MSESTIVFGPWEIPGATLIQFRSALGLELRSTSGMIASSRVNARTIIPILVGWRITHVSSPYTKKRKIQAYKDLDHFMTDNGFPPRPLSAFN